MTEKMQSSSPDRDTEPDDLVEMLGRHPVAAAVLALCSAERLSAIADFLVNSCTASTALRTGLDLGWSVVVVKPDLRTEEIDGQIARAISELTELVDSPGSDVPEFQSELNHAMFAAICALQAVREGDLIEAANAVDFCRDVYFQLAVETWPRLDLDAWLGSPVVQGEVRREVKEAQTISDWRGEIPPRIQLQTVRSRSSDHAALLVLLAR